MTNEELKTLMDGMDILLQGVYDDEDAESGNDENADILSKIKKDINSDSLTSLLPLVSEIIESYKPFVYGLLQEVVKIYADYANNTEVPALNAKVSKNKYDAYVAAGFTEDQAFSLLMKDANQSAKSSAELSSLVKQIIDLMENK